jgi:hypothetical protein
MKPVKKQEWSPKKRQCVLDLLDTGRVTIKEIIVYIKVPKSTIYNTEKCGTPFSKPRIGRPHALSATDKRRLRRFVTKSHKNHRSTPDTIKNAHHFKCSDEVVISALHELGFYCRIACQRPALN